MKLGIDMNGDAVPVDGKWTFRVRLAALWYWISNIPSRIKAAFTFNF